MNRLILHLISWCGLALFASAQSLHDPTKIALTKDAATGTWTMSWPGLTGRTYFLQQSEDLRNWTYFPVIETGADETISWGFTTTASQTFVRLQVTPFTGDPLAADFDGDGMNNWWELRSGIDPLASNDPNANPDEDEATDLQESLANTSRTDPAPVLTLSAPSGASLVP